ncbi:MAG: methyltransferase domain-containing protein [Anaerolineae bacterium]|nr:methyltransferase domain-containing protein [Anaerolineae bacterium]
MTQHDTTRHLVQQQFGRNAQGYVTSETHASGDDLARLVALTGPEPGWRVLDIATGGGHTARTFAPHVQRVVAGDLTFRMLGAARGHFADFALANVVCTQLDAEALPFPTGSFDLVTCRIAPHHFPNVQGFVNEAARVIRPGGQVAVIDQIMPGNRKAARYVNAFERLRDPSHAWAFSRPRWEGIFKAAGLEIVHSEEFTRRHRLAEWAARMRCSPDVVTRLQAMLIQAPEKAAEWLQPELLPGGGDSFAIHHGLLVGRK